MAITTLDGLIAGMQPPQNIYKTTAVATTVGRLQSQFYFNGFPGGATLPAPGINGASLSAFTGQIYFVNPTGTSETYLAKFAANCNVAGTLFLCDRLWHNSGNVVTSIADQNINSVQWPPRSATGTTEGNGVMIGLEVTANLGAGTPTYTMKYVNDRGTSGQTVVTAAQTASMTQGSFIPIQLGSGDTGVRAIQTFKQSATHTSGSYSLVAYRVLARVDIVSPGVGGSIDAITSGFPQLYDNTVPFLLWLPATTTAPTINGQIILAQG